jgi:hypothetical protein
MKNGLLFLFVLVLFNGYGQTNWVQGNPVWHYKVYNPSYPGYGYIKVWDDGDTLLQNQNCRKLKSVKHSFEYINPQGDMAEYVSDYISGIIYYSNDTVFYWEEDHFNVLYDFTANIGESWVIGTNTIGFGCADTSRVNVTGQNTIDINGVNYNEWSLVDDSLNSYGNLGKVNARYGSTNKYLFPFGRSCDMTIVEFDVVTFICFEDDSLYYNPTGEACEYYLGVTENKWNDISIYPNPSAGKFELVSAIPVQKISIVNLVGETVKELNVSFSNQNIDLSELPQGNYYLQIENTNGAHFVKSIQILNK